MTFFHLNNKNKMIITIDGGSAIGKSSLAKALAQKLKYNYFDSGALYRAVTLLAIKNKIIPINNYNKIYRLLSTIKNLHIELNHNTGNYDIFLNGENIDQQIRNIRVSNNVSFIARIPEIRKKLLYIQRKIGELGGIVIDGRDLGSIVFPTAELKIFLTASLTIRVIRRYKELMKCQKNISYQTVYNNIIIRDSLDYNREYCPLIKPKDAIEIDNTNISFEQQLQNIYLLALNKIK